jgi:hypothetical protein
MKTENGFAVRIYICQKIDPDGRPGAVIAAKLVHSAVQSIAEKNRPSMILTVRADKSDEPQHPGGADGVSRSERNRHERVPVKA